MWIWIIHDWRIWFHCIIRTSGWHMIPLHHHFNCICRRPNYFCLRYLQWLSEYHYTRLCRNVLSRFTTSIQCILARTQPKCKVLSPWWVSRFWFFWVTRTAQKGIIKRTCVPDFLFQLISSNLASAFVNLKKT